MVEEKEPLPEWTVLVTRGFFIVAMLFTSLYGWLAAKALSGFNARFEVGVLLFFSAIVGGTIWLAPKRGQMSEKLSLSLLGSLAFVIVYIGIVLARLTDYAHFAASIGKVIK
jgi:hypothetical protein